MSSAPPSPEVAKGEKEPSSPPSPPSPPAARVNAVVFGGALTGVLLVAGWAIFAPDAAADALGVVVAWASEWFGWFYVALATAIFIFVLVIALSRFGSIRLGPDHSTPEFSTFAWASMLFAAGIGTDLMFFSVAEPVSQYLQPPTGEGGTVEAARDATVWTLFHYGITGWAMYALMGMALGYFAFRLRRPLAVRSALFPLFGRRVEGPLGDAVDAAAVLGTIFGVATTLGIGVVQLNYGLSLMFDLPQGLAVQIALIVAAVAMATISAVSGVDRGIRVLSQLNVLLAIGLAAWILVTGRTSFVLNAIVMNIGDLVSGFPAMTAETFAYDDASEWMTAWTLFFWAWWIAWASFVGLFLARISRGRTIRQFVLGTLLIPFTYIVMWISIFGNTAIDRIRQGDGAFGQLALDTPEVGFYTLLQDQPGAVFLIGLATFTGLLFYVTSADSGALVMANLSSRRASPHADGPAWMRIVWAATTGLLTIAILSVGGITALQNATVIMGLPFAVVLVLVMVGLWKALRVEGHRADSTRHALPQAIAGRSGAGDGGGVPWRSRLTRALTFHTSAQATRQLRDVVQPALTDVAAELETKGVHAVVTSHDCGAAAVPSAGPASEPSADPLAETALEEGEGGDPPPPCVELRLDGAPEHPFVYRVTVVETPVPAYGGRVVTERDRYARLEVHLVGGGQGYDVMGYTQLQLIHDCLDQYERHLEFLRLEDSSV